MCAVNDVRRRSYSHIINNLNQEYTKENRKMSDLEQAKSELQQLVDEAQCAINNLGDCNFGGDKILSSVITSQQGYQERMDYYDEYIIKCKKAIEDIKKEIIEMTELRDNLPKNCGCCDECSAVLSVISARKKIGE